MNYDIIYRAADTQNIGSNKILKKVGLRLVNQFNFKEIPVNWYELKSADYGK